MRWPLFLCLLSCSETFPLPMTAAEMVNWNSGPALVAYLSQPDATPAVCDLRAHGPHITGSDREVRRPLVRGLVEGTIEPSLWRRCASAMLRSAAPEDASLLLDEIGLGYRELIRNPELEAFPGLQDRLRAMQQLYIERRPGLDGHPDKLIGELRRALIDHRLGPLATGFGEELVATVDLEHGRWLGRAVDIPLIDELFAKKDEPTLQHFARRLPTQELRDQSRRRVIRIHIATSPYKEVQDHAADVEEILFTIGHNPVAIAQHPATRAWIDLQRMPIRGVLVRQNLWEQTAKLLGYSGDRPGLSVLPEVQLRDALTIELIGVSRPVKLCAPQKDLDPSPCVMVRDVQLKNPAAFLDQGGAFHFVEHIAMRDAVNLAQLRDRFSLPVAVGGKVVCVFDWQLYFERPADFVFIGRGGGRDGPNLGVFADHRDPMRYVFSVSDERQSYLAVVEGQEASEFHIVSRGAMGFGGASGSSGASGASGGECQSGGPGGDGGPGGPGGPGGNGGDIAVQIQCSGHCPDAAPLLQQMVVSLGGPGGPGGAGGAGGSGGSGGPGRSATTHTDSNGMTVTDDPGCSAGSSGPSGSRGSDGSPGPAGRPGGVTFSFVR